MPTTLITGIAALLLSTTMAAAQQAPSHGEISRFAEKAGLFFDRGRAVKKGWPLNTPIIAELAFPFEKLDVPGDEHLWDIEFRDSRDPPNTWRSYRESRKVYQDRYVALTPTNEKSEITFHFRMVYDTEVVATHGPYVIRVAGEMDEHLLPIATQLTGLDEELLLKPEYSDQYTGVVFCYSTIEKDFTKGFPKLDWNIYTWWFDATWRFQRPRPQNDLSKLAVICIDVDVTVEDEVLTSGLDTTIVTSDLERALATPYYENRFTREGIMLEDIPETFVLRLVSNRQMALLWQNAIKAWEGEVHVTMQRRPELESDGDCFWDPVSVKVIR